MPTVWISRPRARATALADALAAANLTPLHCPAMHITAPPSEESLNGYLAEAARFDLSIFVSQEAAQRVAARLPAEDAPPALPALAVGSATAATLAPRYRLLQPPPATGDSSQLLQAVPPPCKKIAVLGGTDENNTPPAPPLCAALKARGCAVAEVVCYQRQAAAPDAELAARGQSGGIDAAVAYSGDSLRYMLHMTAPDNGWLCRLPLFVIHSNIADAARALGFSQVFTGEGDTIAGLIIAQLGAPR